MTESGAPWQTTVWHRQQQYAAHVATHETRSDAPMDAAVRPPEPEPAEVDIDLTGYALY